MANPCLRILERSGLTQTPTTFCITTANCRLQHRKVQRDDGLRAYQEPIIGRTMPHSPTPTATVFLARTEPDDLQVDASSEDPLLLSLEMGGSDWPSSCRNGVCRTCVGQLISGTVRYAVEWPGLSAEEQAEGYVLPCVAHPCSNVVLRQGY